MKMLIMGILSIDVLLASEIYKNHNINLSELTIPMSSSNLLLNR